MPSRKSRSGNRTGGKAAPIERTQIARGRRSGGTDRNAATGEVLPADPAHLDQLSVLIGEIYDCALDPGRWSATLELICRDLGGYSAGIVVLDYRGSADRLVRDWGPTSIWGERMESLLVSIKEIHAQFVGISGPQADEPILLPPQLRPDVGVFDTPFYKDWAAPQGIHQVLEAVALSEPSRLGLFCVTRHVEAGEFSAADLDLLRRLTPHIRRAITISDLLDLRIIERQTFVSVIETLATGVLVVGEDGEIMHANSAGLEMLKEGRLIRADGVGKPKRPGRLHAVDKSSDRELTAAIGRARTDEAGPDHSAGSRGINVALRGRDSRRAVAHVLPLARGEVRTRLMPAAMAAVFVNGAEVEPFADLDAVSRAYGMTRAETRLVARLLAGGSLVTAAGDLGIAYATAKSQRNSVFGRLGVRSQSDLLAQVRRLVPPVRRSR